MAYTAQTLITRSFYLSGVRARELQTVTGEDTNDGLYLLNALLDFKSIQTDLIPYYTYLETIYCVAGQENYFIPNCLLVESVTFNIDVLRYAMEYVPRRTYFGSGRVDNIQTLPFNWYYNRALGGGTLSLYFLPDSNYQLKIMGKFGLQEVALNTDLLTVYDPAYIEYLRFALAEYICIEYGINFSDESRKKLKNIETNLMYVSPPDLSMIKSSMLSTNESGINYGDINIGRGWRPS